MQGKLDSLANRIRQDNSELGASHLRKADLEFIWPEGDSISNDQKCMHVKNFALLNGFAVAINLDSLNALFLISN